MLGCSLCYYAEIGNTTAGWNMNFMFFALNALMTSDGCTHAA